MAALVYGVEIDPLSESFVVLLNPEGTRLLRSWLHVEHCSQCGGEATSESSLRDLRFLQLPAMAGTAICSGTS